MLSVQQILNRIFQSDTDTLAVGIDTAALEALATTTDASASAIATSAAATQSLVASLANSDGSVDVVQQRNGESSVLCNALPLVQDAVPVALTADWNCAGLTDKLLIVSVTKTDTQDPVVNLTVFAVNGSTEAGFVDATGNAVALVSYTCPAAGTSAKFAVQVPQNAEVLRFKADADNHAVAGLTVTAWGRR